LRADAPGDRTPDFRVRHRARLKAQALRALGAPQPKRITECESFSAMPALLAGSDMLAADLASLCFVAPPFSAD